MTLRKRGVRGGRKNRFRKAMSKWSKEKVLKTDRAESRRADERTDRVIGNKNLCKGEKTIRPKV